MSLKSKSNKKLGEIELWRFIFAFIVTVHHSRFLVGDDNCYFLKGSFAVEFFFLLSGYLLMQSIEKMPEKVGNLGEETFSFISKKYKSLYPAVLVALLIPFVAEIFFLHDAAIHNLLFDCVWEASLLQMSGIYVGFTLNSSTWYLSSMLLCMVVLFPLIRRYKKTAVKLIVPVCSVLILGWMCQKYGHMRNPTAWTGFTYRGNLRAFAELGLGTSCYWISKKISEFNFNRFAQVVLTIIKWCFYLIVIIYMYLPISTKNDFFFIGVLMIAISLSFSKQCVDCNLYNNKVIYFLGKYSLYLFLGHKYWTFLLTPILPSGLSVNEQTLIYLAVSALNSAFIMLICELWFRYKKTVISAFKKCVFINGIEKKA